MRLPHGHLQQRQSLTLGGCEMGPFVSFYEFRLTGDRLRVSIGSGLAVDVLERAVPSPNFWVCMRDPQDVTWRVRFGTATVTESGIEYQDWSDFELQGSSPRLFTRASQLATWLGTNGDRLRATLAELTGEWAELEGEDLLRISAQEVRQALVAQVQERERIFVRFDVAPSLWTEVLEQLSVPKPDA